MHQNPSRQEVADARRLTGDTGDERKSPDYLVEGHVFDCSAPTRSASVRSVWSAVRKKVRKGQAQRVVLNLSDWGDDLVALQRQFDEWPLPNVKEVVVVTRGGAIAQLLRRD